MRKKVLNFILIVVFLLMLTGCEFTFFDNSNENNVGDKSEENNSQDKDDSKDEEQPQVPTKEIIKIEVESNGTEYGYQNTSYVPKNISVYAYYSETEKKEITDKCNYTVNTKNLGSALVSVSYDKFITTYNITVVENILNKIIVSTTNAKLVYRANEVFNTDGIIVYGYYLDGSNEQINDFTYSLYYNNEQVSGFILPGNYDVIVKVTVGTRDLYDQFRILVSGQIELKDYVSLELDTSTVKTEFNGEQFTYQGLKVYGVIDSNTKEQLSSNQFLVELIYNGTKVNNFTESGEYTVRISNINNPNLVMSYSVEYIEIEDNTINSILLDTTLVQKEFVGEEFNYDNLKVYGMTSSNESIQLSNSLYKVELLYNNQIVNGFINSGEYKVNITYIGQDNIQIKTLSYTISYEEVTTQTINIEFAYSGLMADSYFREITLDGNINPEDYIVVPTGYAFMGFSEDITKLTYDTIVKIYVKQVPNNQCYVAFLDSNYVYITTDSNKLYNIGNVITVPTLDDPNFIGFEGINSSTITATGNAYYQAIYATTYINSAEPIVTFEDSEVNIIIENEMDSIVGSYIDVMADGEEYLQKDTLNFNLENLEGDVTYSVTGYYIGKKNNQYYKVNLNSKNFNVDVALEVASIEITEEDSQVFQNGVIVDVSKYTEATVEGYELAGFIVEDSKGNQIEQIIYQEGMTEVGVNSLEPNSSYDFIVCYKEAVSVFRLRSTVTEQGLTYNFRFVGYRFITAPSDGVKMYSVKMMYNDYLLYTFYCKENSNIARNVNTFALPNEFADYTRVGTTTDLTNVTSDLECEYILIPEETGPEYTVAFTNYYSTVIKLEKVTAGSSVTPPDVVGRIDTIGYAYFFTNWNNSSKLDSITGTTVFTPYYRTMDKKAPTFDYEVIVASTYINIEYSLYYGNVFYKDFHIEDMNGNLVEGDLTPNTDYKVHMEYHYYMVDVVEPYEVLYEYDVKTVAADAKIDNAIIDVNDVDYHSCDIISGSEDIVKMYYKDSNSENWLNEDDCCYFIYNSCEPSYLTMDTLYNFYYATTDEEYNKVYYVYPEIIEIQTEHIDVPKIKGVYFSSYNNESILIDVDNPLPENIELEIYVSYSIECLEDPEMNQGFDNMLAFYYDNQIGMYVINMPFTFIEYNGVIYEAMPRFNNVSYHFYGYHSPHYFSYDYNFDVPTELSEAGIDIFMGFINFEE